MKDLSTIFAEAADLLERRGWVQGSNIKAGGSRCAGMAIEDVCGVDREVFDSDACTTAIEVLREHVSVRSVPAWNDAADRTAEEVIDTLRTLALIYAPHVAVEAAPEQVEVEA